MNQPIYEHKNQGKTLVSLGFLISAIAIVVLGSSFGASIYLYIPIGFVLLFGAWWFMNNPNHGCILTTETLECWSGKDMQTITVSDLVSFGTSGAAEGANDVSLVIKDGRSLELTYQQFGDSREFMQALEKVGLSTNFKP